MFLWFLSAGLAEWLGPARGSKARANEGGRWKVSENVQEFQEQVASGDMKGGRDKCNRRALQKKKAPC